MFLKLKQIKLARVDKKDDKGRSCYIHEATPTSDLVYINLNHIASVQKDPNYDCTLISLGYAIATEEPDFFRVCESLDEVMEQIHHYV